MLRTHYRSPIDWTVTGLDESKKTIDQWYSLIGDDTVEAVEPDQAVMDSLLDDLNVSSAITRLHGIASEIRASASGQAQIELKRKLKNSAMMLGLLGTTRREYLENSPNAISVNKDAVDQLLADRAAARARKDFKESDRIRDELLAMGVVLKDGKDADGKPVTTWEIAR